MPTERTMKRLQQGALLLALLLALVVTGRLFALWLLAPGGTQAAAMREAGIVMLSESRPLPLLELQSTTGARVDSSQLEPAWHLVFFGYTYCPDICPTTLAELRRIYQALPDEVQARTRVLMVSVDPQRDTPQSLRSYLDFFDTRFEGLTGELEAIQQLSQALGIPFVPGDSSREGYTVDHSGNLALIGPDGRQHGFIRAPLNVAGLIGQLPLVLAAP